MVDSASVTAIPPAAPAAVFKKRGAKGKSVRKRAATPPSVDDSDDSAAFSSSEDGPGKRVKRRKITKASVQALSTDGHTIAGGPKHELTKDTIFEADRSRALDSHNDATKQSNWYDEDADGALSTTTLLGSTRSKPQQGGGEGTYKGLANQASYLHQNPDAPKRAVGPVKAPTNIRTVTITDMAPDVCKDYKRSGFCGFGDNCKFLHARENYLEGWQLDQEWDKVTKGKKNLAGTIVASADRTVDVEHEVDEDEIAMLENIPFACVICGEEYQSPVTTRCGHYFCERCALQRYRKDPSCAACGAGTNGVFNAAKRLQKLLQRKRERAQKRREQARKAGEELSGGEGDE